MGIFTLRMLTWFIPILAYGGWRNYRFFNTVVMDKSVYPDGYFVSGNFSESCRMVQDDPAMKYCEDGAFWDINNEEGRRLSRHLVFSCDPGRREWNALTGPLGKPTTNGALWVHRGIQEATRRDKRETPHQLQIPNFPPERQFHPMGVRIWPSTSEESDLYVINAASPPSVEHFRLSTVHPTHAVHMRSIYSPYMVSPNAIALTSPNSFYVSNSHLFSRRLISSSKLGAIFARFEIGFAFPTGFISHFTLSPPIELGKVDDETAPTPAQLHVHTFAKRFISFANGLSISPSGKKLAVSSSTTGSITFYTRDPLTNELSLPTTSITDYIPNYITSLPFFPTSKVADTKKTKQNTKPKPKPKTKKSATLRLPFLVDNLAYDDDGALIVAGLPNAIAYQKLVKGSTPNAPSWVVSITETDGSSSMDGDDLNVNAKSNLNPNSAQEAQAQAQFTNEETSEPNSKGAFVPLISKVTKQKGYTVQTLFQSNGTGFSASTGAMRDSYTAAIVIMGAWEEGGVMICR